MGRAHASHTCFQKSGQEGPEAIFKSLLVSGLGPGSYLVASVSRWKALHYTQSILEKNIRVFFAC